jgi:hypothetical protein
MKTFLRFLHLAVFVLLFVNSASAHYDPRLGRWLSRDPMGEEGGFNLYSYCGNDPVNRHDPLGLKSLWLGGDGEGYTTEQMLGLEDARERQWQRDHYKNPDSWKIVHIPFALAAVPLAVAAIPEIATEGGIAELGGDLATKGYIIAQNSAWIRGIALLGSAAVGYGFVTDSDFRGAMISTEGAASAEYLASSGMELFSAGRAVLRHPYLNPGNYDWNPFFSPLRGRMFTGMPVPGMPRFRVPSPEVYKMSLPTVRTPTTAADNLYEIANTGPLNYQIKAGGVELWADGIMGKTIQEAKFVGNAS